MKRWCEEESKHKKGVEFDWSGWQIHVHKNVPQQENGYDCGCPAPTPPPSFGPLAQDSGRVSMVVRRVFMCQFIKWLAAGDGERILRSRFFGHSALRPAGLRPFPFEQPDMRFPFGQPDMPNLRLQMVHELCIKEIQMPP